MGERSAVARTADPAERLTGRELANVVAMFLGTFTVGIDSFILSPLLSTMATTFESTTSRIALGVTAYAIAYAIGAPLLSPLGDRFGSQPVAVLGMLIFAGSTLGAAAQTSLPGLYAFRALAGLGGSMWMPNIQAHITRRWAPPLSTKLLGVVVAGLSAAIALGVPVGAWAASVMSWQQTFLGVAGLGALAALGLLVTMAGERRTPRPPTRRLREYASVLRTRPVRMSLTSTLLWMTGFYGVYTFLGTFLQHRLGIGVTGTGTYLIAYGVGNFAASMTSGWVNTALGAPQRAVLVFGMTSSTAVVLLTLLPLNPALTVVLLLCWAFSQGYATTGLITLASASATGSVATVLGLNSSLIYVGTALGSALFGLLHGSAFLTLGLPAVVLTLAAAAFATATDHATSS